MSGFEAIGRGGVPLVLAITLVIVGLAAVILYVRHASRHANPILDLLLFRVPSFAIAVGGGSLFRIGIGALPFLLSYATFRPGIPSSVILVLLLAGGFFRSLQFTSTNTLAFADVPPTRISRATSMTSTAQQLSVSMGVALGATLLHLTLLCRGTSA